jgi:hypothetical protein
LSTPTHSFMSSKKFLLLLGDSLSAIVFLVSHISLS